MPSRERPVQDQRADRLRVNAIGNVMNGQAIEHTLLSLLSKPAARVTIRTAINPVF